MSIFAPLLQTLPQGTVKRIYVGEHRSAVCVEVAGKTLCAVSATASPDWQEFSHSLANYTRLSALELANLVYSDNPAEVGIGLATVNALLPRQPHTWQEIHSKDLLAELGAGKTIAMVGHFPFVDELRPLVGKLNVLELNPKDENDLPASAAPEIIPQADVLAITAMTLINHTFDGLLALRRPGTPTVVIGPSTPLSPLMFDLEITHLSGAVIENADAIFDGLVMGCSFRELRKHGARMVTISADRR